MEIVINSNGCTKCKGIENCNKTCILHSGKALVDFIKRADMIETRIGDFSSREKGKKQDLVVYGHQLYDLKSPSWLLTDINTSLDATDKFKKAFDKNAFQIASMYCKYVNMPDDEANDILEKIKKLKSNKLIILPFKPHTQCNIDYTYNGSTEKRKDAEIHYLKWITNKETYKLECTICFSVNSTMGNQLIKMDIKDYLNSFRLSQMEIQAKGDKYDKRLISVSDYGIFKPIVVKSGNVTVAVDGTYLYYGVNSDINIVGYWNEYDKLAVTMDIKSPAFDKIRDNIDLIKNHKKYIAPYMLYEPNIIEI